MSNLIDAYLNKKLNERKEAGNFRQLPDLLIGGIDFCSSDYLGLAHNKELHEAIDDESCVNGATGARLLSGNSTDTEALEQQIAKFHQAESALLYNSGYTANLGLLTAIADRHTVFLYDELCHASIHDGIRLSLSTKKYKFKHNDIKHLESLLEKHNGSPLCVIVESVYSMDGDFSPLEKLTELSSKFDANLIVDEAHATGVFGEKGEGRVQELGLQNKVWARVHTFGKALGLHGAAVVGSKLLTDALINLSRSFIYTTALPPDNINKIKSVYSYLDSSEKVNKKLHEVVDYFNSKRSICIGKWLQSKSPIQGIVIGDNIKAKELSKTLHKKGISVFPILSPTVPKGTERIRVSLHSYNTKEEIDLLFDIISEYLCKEQ